MKYLAHTAALAVLGLLAACGGGTEPAAEPQVQAPREVPATAATSPEAYSRFVAATLADDGGEPLGLQQVQSAPTSEVDEPLALGSGG